MPYLQELNTPQINEAIALAVDKHVPATVTIQCDGRWVTYHSRFLQVRGTHILVEYPFSDEDQAPHEFSPAEKISLTFKLKHYKHIASATIAGASPWVLEDGSSIQALDLCCPTKMQRAQRRAYLRVDIPDNRIVRVSFWHGGSVAEPSDGQGDQPIWSGRVTNLSAGGVQVAVDPDVAEQLEPGDFLGVHISFGAGDGSVQADAQFRHTELADGRALLGLQFVGLEQTQRGQQTLLAISRRVAEYRKQAERRAWRAQAS